MTGSDGISSRTDAGVQRYLESERAFWRHYGLTATDRFVKAGPERTRLRVQEVGSGEPILFVHGTGGSGAYFAPLIRELVGFRCLIIDRPGWGLSEPVDFAAHEYNKLVTQLLGDALDELGVDRLSVVGGSIGNNWVLRLAQARSSQVERIVWLGGFAMAELGVPMPIKLMASPVGRLMVRLGEKESVMRKQLAGRGHATTVESGSMDAFLAWRVVEAKEIHSLQHERRMVRAIRSRQGWAPEVGAEDADFGGIAQPALLVYGTNDPLGTVDFWRRKVGLMPRGEFEVVEGGGHLTWYDDPAGVGSRVQRFLAA